MSRCSHYPLHEVESLLTRTLDYVLTPACFATGSIGCLTALVVLHRAQMRRESPVYAFLAAIAAVDLFGLASRLPSAFRQIELFDIRVSYSYGFTLLSSVSSAIHLICTHSCYWLLAFCLIVNYSNQPDISKRKSPKWTRISAARLMAFLNILFSGIIDVPSFVEGHCFAGMELYYINRTHIDVSPRILVGGLFTYWYPNIQMISLVAVPIFLIIIFALVTLLLSAAARSTLIPIMTYNRGRMIDASTRPILVAKRPLDQEERRSQLNSTLVATSYYYSEWFAVRDSGALVSQMPYKLAIVTNALYIVAIASQFLIHTTLNNDFIMCFKRTFCFACKAGDVYVETPSCFGHSSCCHAKSDDIDFSIEKTARGVPLTPTLSTGIWSSQKYRSLGPNIRRSAPLPVKSSANRSLPRRPDSRRRNAPMSVSASIGNYATVGVARKYPVGVVREYLEDHYASEMEREYKVGISESRSMTLGRVQRGSGTRSRRAGENNEFLPTTYEDTRSLVLQHQQAKSAKQVQRSTSLSTDASSPVVDKTDENTTIPCIGSRAAAI